MAAISDSLYNTSGDLVQTRGDLSRANEGMVMSPFSNTELFPSAEGMDAHAAWSSWRSNGSGHLPSNYPCVLANGGVCSNNRQQECGKSLTLRENSAWTSVFGSADGTGYVTTQWLPPNATFSARIGDCYVSRETVSGKPMISQLYLNGKVAIQFNNGQPFFFKTEQTPFIYMVPNAIMARVSGLSYRIDTVWAGQVGQSCEECL